MTEGNPAIEADPTLPVGQQATDNTEPLSPADAEAKALQVTIEKAKLEERYAHSSTEAKRLNEALKAAEAKIAAFEQRSLTTQSQPSAQDSFPSREAYIKAAVENWDKTEKEAGADWQREHTLWQNQKYLENAIQALHNKQQFEAQLREQTHLQDPEAKEASEFFKKFPEIDALPTIEKVERYRTFKQQFGTQVSGRDTSAAKIAAGGASSHASTRTAEVANPQADEFAKKAGYPSYKALMEFKNATTAKQHAELKAKYRMK